MSAETILVADDDHSVRKVVSALLEEEGFSVIQAADGLECVKEFYTQRPDLVILDILMPQKNGREVCRQLREISPVPIIMMTAISENREKIERLNQGADDYVTKPFDNDELIARVNALLRRAHLTTAQAQGFNDGILQVIFSARQVYLNGTLVHLSNKEWSVLEYLIKHKDQVVRRATLLKEIWGTGYENANNILKVIISNLRRKLGEDVKHPRYIRTDFTIGYCFQTHR